MYTSVQQSFDSTPQYPHQHYQYSSSSLGSAMSIKPSSGSPLVTQRRGVGINIRHSIRRFTNRISTAVERTQPYYAARWILTILLLLGFMFRIVISQGWYVVTYALWIYLLNAFLAFLTPKFDISGGEIENDADLSEQSGPALPTTSFTNISNDNDEEFRPFVRRLPEFVFWHSVTCAIILSIAASFFPIFDIPVFWPILLFYFIILLTITMKRQIKHMLKYKYIPFDFGKKTYGNVDTNSAFGTNMLSNSSGMFPGGTFQKNGSSPTSHQIPFSSSLPNYVPPVPYSFRDSQH